MTRPIPRWIDGTAPFLGIPAPLPAAQARDPPAQPGLTLQRLSPERFAAHLADEKVLTGGVVFSALRSEQVVEMLLAARHVEAGC